MFLDLPTPGTYVVAVSGGVDSLVLLDLLNNLGKDSKNYKFIVAHLDHGIRDDSNLDKVLVESYAKKYNLPFVYHRAYLGNDTSENKARNARYDFLNKVKDATSAHAIITAHHEDDLIETALINIARGTGRKGLSSIVSNELILRPLIAHSKNDLIKYAKDNQIIWREDSTNQDSKYLRNHIRHSVLNKLNSSARTQLVTLLNKQAEINKELDNLIDQSLKNQKPKNSLNRFWFSHLPHLVAKEIMASWLRANNIRNFDSNSLERLVIAGKVGSSQQKFPVTGDKYLNIHKDHLALEALER